MALIARATELHSTPHALATLRGVTPSALASSAMVSGPGLTTPRLIRCSSRAEIPTCTSAQIVRLREAI
jgi:hypothetical protein